MCMSVVWASGSAAQDKPRADIKDEIEHDMRDVYGQGVAAKDVLNFGKLAAPAAVRAFPDTLAKYSPRRAGATSSR
jgi:hypothetical protein